MNTNEDMLVYQIGEEKCAYGSASGGGHGNNLGESVCYSQPTVTPGRSDGSAFGNSAWTDFAMTRLLNRLAQ